MARINACIKVLFAFFNAIFAIVGGVILLLAIMFTVQISAHGIKHMPGMTIIVVILYILGGITMTISLLGACGACNESRGALITFLVCMVIVTLGSLKVGIPHAITRPIQDHATKENFRAMLPLDRAETSNQDMVIKAQEMYQCCGLFGPSDWEDNVPQSCSCNADVTPDKCSRIPETGRSVYKEPCFPIFMYYTDLGPNIILAVTFSVAFLAILGMVLSSVMIHQLGTGPSRPPMVMTVPAVFSTKPPKYEEIHNLSHY